MTFWRSIARIPIEQLECECIMNVYQSQVGYDTLIRVAETD